MMKFLRSQSQTVLVLILVVLGGSFLFYGNVGNNLLGGGGGRGNDFGRIDGENVSVSDLYDSVRMTRNDLLLGNHADELNQPGVRKEIAEQAWSRLLLLHEADRLHVQVSDQEVIAFIKKQPIFQKDGVYSPELYQKQLGLLNDRLHISSEVFEKWSREKLRLDAISAALILTVHTGAGDLAAKYAKYNGPVQVSVVTIDPKTLLATTVVAPADVEAEYKAHPDNPEYRTAEKRKVDYVLLNLSPDQAKLPAKDKGTALEALGEKALDFALSLQPDPSSTNAHPEVADFKAQAAKKGLPVMSTDFFAADAPPSGLPPSPAFNNAAFELTKDNPVSKVIELDNGVAVLHLDDTQASQVKPLDEVRGAIVSKLSAIKAGETARVKAKAVSDALRAAVAGGKDFKSAAAAENLTVQTVPSFIPAKTSSDDPRLQMIAVGSVDLEVGGVSPPLPIESNNTMVVVHVDSRSPADSTGLANFEERYRGRQDEQVRTAVFADWVSWMSKQRGTHPPPDLESYGGIE